MIAAAQIVVAIGIGVLGYMWALCLSGLYDGILSLVFQPLIAVVVSSVAVFLIVAPTGLLLRLLPFTRRTNRNGVLVVLAFVTGAALMVLSAAPGFAVVVQGLEVPEVQLHPSLALAGWALLMASPFFMTAGRQSPDSDF